MYEICNEPNGVDWKTVKRYAEAVIPVIREKTPDSVIIVGDPYWSQDLDSVVADPLDFDNIMYSLHFYSASHGVSLSETLKRACDAGLPVFVSEFGITAATGDLPRNIGSADAWIELLEQEHVSYCMWALSKVNEACAMIRHTVPKDSGFDEDDLTQTGLWLISPLNMYRSR